jgi:hypothetical protein
MTVEILATELGLWAEIREKIKGQAGNQAQSGNPQFGKLCFA